jgi:hypothetical protein
MLDDATGSVWSHLDGTAVAGALAGAQMAVLPLQTMTWGDWLAEHPETTTLDPLETELAWVAGYEDATGRPYPNRLALGDAEFARSFADTVDGVDGRLPANELVIGVLAGTEARAFAIAGRPEREPMQGSVGGVPVVILEDAGGTPSLAYHRTLSDGRVLEFERDERGVVDVGTGSRWTSGGLAFEGELRGVQLVFVTSFLSEWYGWAAFHPDTSIHGAETR